MHPPRRNAPLLPLEERRRDLQRSRGFSYSLMLALVVGLLAYVPLPDLPAGQASSWWPFGGSTEAPETDEAEVVAGDGTADMEIDWDPEAPDTGAEGLEPVDFGTFEAEPQALTLQTDGTAPTGYVEGRSQEKVSERTESTTVFTNPDGTETLRIYEAPAFVQDGEGEYVPIDPTLQRTGERWSPEAAADVSFAANANEADIIRFGVEGSAIAYGLADARSVAAQVEGHQVTYADILPHTDLRFTAAGWGAKADIILGDASAATSWTFPLTLDAVTAAVNETSGAVEFRDADGAIVAVVPAGFAEDSNIRADTGEGERTYALDYTIVDHEGGQALQVSLDEDWLADPARVFPVIVDPTLSSANGITSGDTYVLDDYTANYSGEGEIKVGHVDGLTAAGLLKFDTTMAALDNKYIRGATLSLYNTYSYSCNARTVKVHRITESWSAGSAVSWPGPSFESTALASKTFAHGYSSSCGNAWETFTLNPDKVTQWVHGKQSFYGFRIEASRTDDYGWKKFASKQTSTPSAMPFMDVVYSDQGAKYELPNGGFTTAVTAAQTGILPVKVTNWGSATWKAGTGYHLRVKVYDRNDKEIRASEGPFYAPTDVAPHTSATFTAKVAPLPPGHYKLRIVMVDPQGTWFSASPYSLPWTWANFDVVNLPPLIAGISPAHGATTDSIQPTLWTKFNDADTPVANATYQYKVCRDAAAADCTTSGWKTTPAWKIPTGFLTWGTPAYWFAQVSDGTATSPWTTAIQFTPQPSQPPVTSHLAGASDGSTVPGLNPQIGNFTTTVTDANVTAVGPTLAAQRTYNSQDLRTTGAFGTGWSTPWDQRLTVEPEATVLAVLESGRTVRFGKNPDGTFASPLGESFELQATGTGYRMQDTSGEIREFNTTGQLVRITDAFGRGQTLTYTSGKLTKVTDEASGRSLTLEWTGAHVTAVVVPPAQTGGSSARWTYTYTGDLLIKACTPLSTVDCTTYQYESTSFYEATVQDANPKSYYTFDEVGVDSVVSNRAADAEGEYDARKIGLLHTPVGGALAASDGRALDLGAGATSAAQLPDNLFGGSVTVGIELWFRAEPGERGTLFSIQKTDDGALNPACYNPLLYLDTSGYLRSGFWMSSGSTTKRQEMVSTTPVDDGKWHQVVLTSAATQQWLYLDGAVADTESGRTVDQTTCGKALVGNGWGTSGWPGMPATAGYYPYQGEFDDLSLYTRTTTAEEIAFRYKAGNNGTSRMTGVTNDQGHALWTVDYDRTTGRVLNLTDTNGAAWELSDPQLSDAERAITLTSSYGKSEQYTYDAAHNGRLVSRSDAIGTATWEYNDDGFVASHTDEVGLTTAYTTDDQGRRTSVTACRAEGDCSTSHTGFYTATDPFDLRDGQVLWQADGRSASATDTTYRTTYTYNTKGQLLTTVSPGSSTSSSNPNGTASITYTTGTESAVGGGTVPAGLTATVTDESSAVTTLSYDKAGDLVETLAPSGQVTRYGYDLLGRLTSTQIGAYSGGQFQARDTVTHSLDALGHTTASTGTAFTNPVTGNTHRLRQTFPYDQYGRPKSTSSWDEANPLAVRTTNYTYDTADRLVNTTYPDGSAAHQRWNTAGLLETETTSTGLELAYTYDERARLLTTSAVGTGVDPTDATADDLLLEYRTYYDNNWAASTTDALGRETSWEYWADGTVKRTLHTGPDGTETVTAQYEYDKAGNATKVTDAVGTLTQTNYNARNWPTSTTIDPTGIADATHFAYDKTGRTTGITYKYGGTTYKVESYSLNPAGSATASWTTATTVEGTCVTDSGRSCVVTKTANTYNSEGLLTSAQVGNDGAETYTYNTLGQIATTTGAARDVWVDGINEGSQQPVTTYGYNAFGELTHLEDAAGNITETEYDTSGRPVRTLLPAETVAGSTEPIRPQMLTNYLPGGLVSTEANALGAVTAYQYDLYGRTLSVTNPDPDGDGSQTAPVTTYAYDRAGQVIAQTNPNGAATTATYDPFGRNATVTQVERTNTGPAYFTTSNTYDAAGQLTSSTTPGGNTTTYTYDRLGRTTTVTDPTGTVSTNTYPTATSATTTFADGGDGITRRQTVTSDVLGNPVKETSEINTGSGWTTVQCAQSRYDLAGRTISSTTIRHATCTTPDTTYTYDTAGQPTAITGTATASSAIALALGYDLLGHQTRMVDGNGNTTVYGFNDWGLQDTTIEPATTADPDPVDRTWTTIYDIAGNAVEQHLPGGVTQTAEYDRLGRKTTEAGTGAEASTTVKHFTWDATGQLTGFSSDLGDTEITYNDRGSITAITGGQAATYAYNADGQLTERTDAAGTTGFTYDDGRLTTLTDPLTNTTLTYQWRGDGQLAGITTPTSSQTFTYEGYGQLTGDTVTAGGQTKSINYDYDGQLLTAKTTTGLPNDGTQTYAYDGQGRLTSWTDATGVETTYSWDANSNRIATNQWNTECGEAAAETRLYVYDERNRLTEAMDGANQCVQTGDTWTTQTVTPTADETWSYTPRGTTATHIDTEGIQTTYAFDAFEQLKTAVVDGTGVTNQYDALGRLIARNGATFAYDGLTNNLTAAPNGTGTDHFTRGITGETVAATSGGITGLTWSDNHGDLVAVLNPTTGDLITGGGFDPFGNPLPGSTANTLGFQGGYTDPTTGETNAHARWYNPETASFTARDTWQLSPSPIAQTNRYLYGNASPVNLMDLNGHKSALKLFGLVAFGSTIVMGRCDTAMQTGVKASENAWEWYWNVPNATKGSTSGMKGGSGGGSRYYGHGRYGPGAGTQNGNDTGYDPDDFDFPNPWIPLVPFVPLVIDWTALITLPVGTAMAAALLEGAITLLAGALMKNEDEDTDQSQKQIDLLNEALEGNESLQNELANTGLITQEDGKVVGVDFRNDGESCERKYHYGDAPTFDKGSSDDNLGGDRATWAAAYLCGPLSRGDEPKVNPWDWPATHTRDGKRWPTARCHLVARDLGGSGLADNLVTCPQERMNNSNMKPFEQYVKSQVNGGKDVVYISVPQYNTVQPDVSRLPALSGIQVIALGADGSFWTACFAVGADLPRTGWSTC